MKSRAIIIVLDAAVPRILSALGNEDVLFVTADHGCDPTNPSTDHSREYVSLLAYQKRRENRLEFFAYQSLGVRKNILGPDLHCRRNPPTPTFVPQKKFRRDCCRDSLKSSFKPEVK